MSHYQQVIGEAVGDTYDPRHIEAFMRLQHGTLDSITRDEFIASAREAASAVDEVGETEAEEIARMYAL